MANPELRTQLQQSLADVYELGQELPRGGMSRVFAAKEKALGRSVVIKVLSPELAATLSAERFKREIRLAARLQHPHIVPLLSAGVAAESLYFTMPLVEGESLRDRINRERPMAIDNAARILLEVAGALEYAHGQGVVHRDIKPENVMFFHDTAVVLDFGIGKALTAATDDNIRSSGARITQSGMSLGTPMYISPEQAAGDPDLDHRADIYSLGVVAYEMLTGHPPFTGRTPQAVFLAHAEHEPEPVTTRREGIPGPLAAIVMRCLAKQPKDRPQSAADITRVLRGTPSGGIPALRVPTLVDRIPYWVPWTIAGIAVAALAAALLLR
ncbi:MAG TPA: serine/threonine-protein kinase [Gemmatimonadaceae bacterium]|nr:serine/threonine-protein kinase [Gemmatimonadaceae bacterium]